MSDYKTMLVLEEISDEREAQDQKWGQQDWPPFLGETDRRKYEHAADRWKAVNAARAASGMVAWDGILLEEVFEALSESNPQLRRAELLQVAAVAAAEVEALDRMIAEFEEQD